MRVLGKMNTIAEAIKLNEERMLKRSENDNKSRQFLLNLKYPYEEVEKKMLKCEPNDNKFCVPAALALILDIPVSESVALIKEELGDTEITGVFPPIILKIITQKGWTYKLAPFTTKHHIFLIAFKGHVGVYREGLYYDNFFGRGINDLPSRQFGKVEHIFLCEKP